MVKSESKLSTSGNINFSDVYPLMPNMLNVFSVFTCTRVHAGRGMCSFIEFLYSSIPRSEGDDTLTWKFTKTGVFNVCSYYKLLPGPLTEVFPWKCIWCAKVPKRVSFFLWTAARDGILTIDNLVKRGQSLVNRCCLCCCDGEIVDHFLLHCKLSHALWSAIFEVFRIHWVMPKTVCSLLFAWRNWFGKHLSTIWNMVGRNVIYASLKTMRDP